MTRLFSNLFDVFSVLAQTDTDSTDDRFSGLFVLFLLLFYCFIIVLLLFYYCFIIVLLFIYSCFIIRLFCDNNYFVIIILL